MSTEPISARNTEEMAGNLTWIRTETLGFLLLGVMGLHWVWIGSYATHREDIWPGWGLPVLMLPVIGACFLLRGFSYWLTSAVLTAVLVSGPSILLLAPNSDGEALSPFLFVIAVLIGGALQGMRTAVISAAIASIVILGRTFSGMASVSSPFLAFGALSAIWLTVLVSWATTRNLYTALHWAWANSEQAEKNLSGARQFQAKLVAALRQVEEANYRLERANHALSVARAEAEEARRLKAQFAAHVSHELRTPINLVVGFSELMLSSPETYGDVSLPDQYVADLTTLHSSARHLQGLIDDILDLSQIDVGEMPVLKDIAEVGAIVHEAVATARQLLERKGLAVEVDVASDLPLLHVDRLRIRQVLLNLLNNASRFTDHGGVRIRAYEAGQEVVIEVTDTGVGIASQDLSKLFEPYHQLDRSPTRSRGGTGLGLAISKKFVDLHGGRIWAWSSGVVGRGSTFAFAIPVQPGDPDVAGAPGGDPTSRWRLPAPAPNPTLVVLDDDPAIVSLFQRHLQGFQIAGASGQLEAIALAKSRRAQAIVTDLPDGTHLDEWHRHWSTAAQHSGVRLLACPMPSGRRAARTIGLIDYLVKPVTQEALLRSVRTVAPEAKTILVVDDEPKMVTLLCRILRAASSDYRLLRAYDGEQALEIMGRVVPDLVLLDILMPQVDGLAVLEKMRADGVLAGIPVIAVTARGAVEAISPSIARTFVMISDQPFTVSQTLAAVRAAVGSLPLAEAAAESIASGSQGDEDE